MKIEIKFRTWQEGKMYFHSLCDYLGSSGIINEYVGCEKALWMQFTGLKDKNGIDIYEGDIVNANYFKNVLVVFWRYGWHFNTRKDCHHSFNTASHSFEIIGNIHENPELIYKK